MAPWRAPIPGIPLSPLLYVLRDQFNLHGTKFGLRPRAMRRMHGADGWQRNTRVHDAGEPRGWTHDHDHRRSRHSARAASSADRVHRRAGRAVRLLHERHDHDGAAFLSRTPKPTMEQAKQGLAGNLCRCGTHTRILRAVVRAAGA